MDVGDELTTSDLPLEKLAAPARRALAGAGYTQLADLTQVTESQVAALHGMGPKALKTLREALAARGLAFAVEDSNNRPEMKLEVVVLPVADVDAARDFYAQKIGFNLDFDSEPSAGVRVVQLTPHGSGCSIVIGTGVGEISEMKPGSIKGLTLVVKDIAAVRELLAGRGVAVGDIIEYPRGIKFVHFSDPDGNAWALQEIPEGL